jgi:hypothetical protein
MVTIIKTARIKMMLGSVSLPVFSCFITSTVGRGPGGTAAACSFCFGRNPEMISAIAPPRRNGQAAPSWKPCLRRLSREKPTSAALSQPIIDDTMTTGRKKAQMKAANASMSTMTPSPEPLWKKVIPQTIGEWITGKKHPSASAIEPAIAVIRLADFMLLTLFHSSTSLLLRPAPMPGFGRATATSRPIKRSGW